MSCDQGKNENAHFPLTPALSLRERENLSPRVGKSQPLVSLMRRNSAPARVTGTVIESIENRLERGDKSGGSELVQRQDAALPLPKGEGWGEGKRTPAVSVHKQSGVVVPHAPTFGRRLVARAIYTSIRALDFTLRHRDHYHPGVLESTNRPLIFCIWHNRLALALIMYEHYARRTAQRQQLAAMVSASRDGGMLARILELFRTQPVRGSSSRRGPQALLELSRWAARGYDLAITPDGPRGPRYKVQPGIIALAQITGRPIIPSGLRIQWKVCLKSWDRFQVPIPFSRVDILFSEPLLVPRDASNDQREAFRLELEKRLMLVNGESPQQAPTESTS